MKKKDEFVEIQVELTYDLIIEYYRYKLKNIPIAELTKEDFDNLDDYEIMGYLAYTSFRDAMSKAYINGVINDIPNEKFSEIALKFALNVMKKDD
jgi:hypothetical protein